MVKKIRAILQRMDSGQAMIMTAILISAIMGTCGLAVEGGRILVEYRRMQSAADMAAIIAAQDATCKSTDTTCINKVYTDGCTWAQNNGFGAGWPGSGGTCTASNGTTATVDYPPNTCSPYNLSYDNGKQASNNCGGSAASTWNYVEVELTRDLGTIPFFNIHIVPGTHAVARKGATSPRDYAIVVLDNSIASALTLSGSGGSGQLYVVGSVISNSTAATSIKGSGGSNYYTCGGEWDTASATETTAPTQLKSFASGAAYFSPAGCTTTTPDTTTNWNYGQFPVNDPYPPAVSSVPPTSSGNWTACPECTTNGHYYHWTSTTDFATGGKWDENGAGTPGNISKDFWEFFPGIYPNGIQVTGGSIYFNPGVYTIKGGGSGLKINGGNTCVWGAPICDRFPVGYHSSCTQTNKACVIPGESSTSCGNGTFPTNRGGTYTEPQIDPWKWYYYCSPWGTWDTNRAASAPTLSGDDIHSDLSTTPAFTISNTPVSSGTIQYLNGVTFYLTGGTSVDVEGNAVMSLAFPNPCPGTDTANPGTNLADMQIAMGQSDTGNPNAYTGNTVQTYSYSGNQSWPNYESTPSASSPTGQIFPSADLTVNGEQTCRNTLSGSIPDVWPGEITSTNNSGQLLHFLIWMRDSAASIKLAGGGVQLFWGTIYNPGTTDDGTAGCGGSTSGCQISLTGGSGGTGGPPMLIGQVIGDGVGIGGSSTIEVFYRPCDPTTTSCNLGPGSSLVQ